MKALPLVLASLLLGACASTQNLAVSPDTLASMQGKSLIVVQRESPSFVAMTSGKGMFAVAGVGAAAVAGNKMVKETGIVDPAMKISRDLANGLAQANGMTLSGVTDAVPSGKVDSVGAVAKGSDYALDVVTNGWSYMYDGFNMGDYFVGYSSKLRLIDVKSGQVISAGLCAYDAKKAGKSAVSHETLLSDNAAYIKKELADATVLCVEEFASKLFTAPAMAKRIP